ncbi:MAG: thiamine-monophosphate kinase [Candidatus Omnitrophica bacterium]|nr:thiamine-monophosphate kinase [Candidatus Omnitrophota bacterium]
MEKKRDNEQRLINLITNILGESDCRVNKCFESDAEIVKFGDSYLLFTMDEFSSEDMLLCDNPYTFGWNMAIGGISDILACGGIPLFYAHAITVDKNWDEQFIKGLFQGVLSVLKKSNTAFIGGDVGEGNEWRYTVSIIGKLDGKPIMRKGGDAFDIIYISGEIGSGNLQAALKLYPNEHSNIIPAFNLRLKESVLIREYATSCIDTSDGVFNALNTISQINNTGYIVENLPYIKDGLALTKRLSLPKTLLFLAEAGEYELLFTIKQDDEQEFLQKATANGFLFYRLGQIISSPARILFEDGQKIDLEGLNISARDYNTTEEYLSKIMDKLSGGLVVW